MRNPLGIPTYDNMMCELLQALKKLGGSGTISEIDDKTIEILALLSGSYAWQQQQDGG